MKKLSFAGPILLTTILLFAAACGKNTATETVPPQTQIASESDFSEETSMNGQTDSCLLYTSQRRSELHPADSSLFAERSREK